MSKELVISATPHETRVAILEEGQLCEIYVEREKEFALVGSIYKGRVTRVLPGMQSAFVEIGLDSDAFLYVSDFLDNLEEYEHIATTVEDKVEKMEAQGGQVFTPATPPAETQPAGEPGGPAPSNDAETPPPEAPAGEAAPAPPATSVPAPAPPSYGSGRPPRRDDPRGFGRRGRRGRRGGRDRRPNFGHGRELPPSKFASHRPYEPPDQNLEPIILPGESLAKYKGRAPSAPAAEGASPQPPAEETTPATATGNAEQPSEAGWVESTELPAAPSITVENEHALAPPQAAAPETTPEAAAGPVAPAPQETVETKPAEQRPAEETGESGNTSSDLSPEEATALAEHVAEAQQEEIEAAEASHEEDSENGKGPDEHEEIREAASEEASDSTEEEQSEVQAGEGHEAEIPEERQPTSARVESHSRPRFQRPMRRGGRDRRGPRGRHHPRHQAPRRPPQQISELLKAGQEVIVQIAKEPLGKKGARITSHVALPGRFLVYMPTVDHIGVSRKINSSEHRSRLRRLVLEAKGTYPGGFIVRTAAENASDEEIRTDIDYLGHTWQEIKSRAEQRKAPSLLHRDLNLVERVLRDHFGPDFTSVWIDSEEEFTKVVEFVNRFQPSLVNRVKLYTRPAPIFEEFGIQQEIDKALRPKVWLKSGGYIVINHTEALVAIDINTGKFVGKGSTRLEDTIVKTNLEAVKEIVRQIRLRDLGGIIVIDFIDMEERKNRQKVMQALDEALRADKAPSKVLAFNEFGLVAITRKRTKQALERTLCQPCPYCTGSGMVKSVPTLCYEIQSEARKMAQELDGQSLTLRVHPEIAKALKTRESVLVEELEQWTHKSVIIQTDPSLHWEQYDIY